MTGTFDDVIYNLPNLQPSLLYGSDYIDLMLLPHSLCRRGRKRETSSPRPLISTIYSRDGIATGDLWNVMVAIGSMRAG